MLSKLGFLVENASGGEEALGKVKTFAPDLILLNTLMPGMSGWELTRLLKQDFHYRGISIIMFSALDDVKEKVEGFALGVDDYITKPFNFSEVLARIKAALRNRELLGQIAARESCLSAAEALNAEVRRGLAGMVNTLDEIDEAIAGAGRERVMGNSGELEKWLGILAEKSREARERAAALDSRIEKTLAEWDNLKKSERVIPVVESGVPA
jgi:PleD family two-component response regulator